MFGLKLVKEADYYKMLQKKQEVENLNHDLNIRVKDNVNAVENLKATKLGLNNQLFESKKKNDILRSDVDGLEAKLIASQNSLAALSKEHVKINEKNVNLEKEVKTKEVIIENYTDKMSTDSACIIELENKLSKLQEKYDFEHVENKMKIKGFDRGQYYQVLGISSKAGMFAKLGSISTRDLRDKIFNFDQLKHEILTRGLDVSSLDIVRVDVKI